MPLQNCSYLHQCFRITSCSVAHAKFSEGHDVVEYGLIIAGASESHSRALRHGRWFKADPELGTTTGVLTLPATVSLLWIQAFIECYSQAQSLQLPVLVSNLETQAMNFAVKEWYHRIFALPPRDLPTHASRRGSHCPHHRLPLRLHRNQSVWPQATESASHE